MARVTCRDRAPTREAEAAATGSEEHRGYDFDLHRPTGQPFEGIHILCRMHAANYKDIECVLFVPLPIRGFSNCMLR
jgi:hypothetical protein